MKNGHLPEAALDYIASGFSVIPLESCGKEPFFRFAPNGVYSATRDKGTAEIWWGAAPSSNIGLPMGGGIFVVDPDGAPAVTDFQAICADNGGLPRTRTVRTARGFHYYLRSAVTIPNGKLTPDIDIISTGKYVLAPPSVHPDGPIYELTIDAPIAEAPDWLVSLILAAKPESQLLPAPRPTARSLETGSSTRERKYATAALASECATVASTGKGDRNNTLNAAAVKLGHYVACGWLDEAEVYRVLEDAARQCRHTADKGLRATRSTIRSGLKKGMSEPAGALPPAAQQNGGWDEKDRAYVPPGEPLIDVPPPLDREGLLLSAWLDLPIPSRDYLLGGFLCTTSRVMLIGETGIGKTLCGMEMGGGMAAGHGALGWAGQRQARVMYLDGEMPAETFKERSQLIAGRHGRDIPFYGYNRERLGDYGMPPLNTPDGQKWFWHEVDAIKPDSIFFDSIMCLLIGDIKTPEAWQPMLPLICALSAKRIAQVWLHHANEQGKGFGDKAAGYLCCCLGYILQLGY